MEPRGAEVDGTAQASGKTQPSDGKRAYVMADDATRFRRELRQLREENSKLKRLVADLTLDKHILGEVVRKKL